MTEKDCEYIDTIPFCSGCTPRREWVKHCRKYKELKEKELLKK